MPVALRDRQNETGFAGLEAERGAASPPKF
jgi:hypothetical protein